MIDENDIFASAKKREPAPNQAVHPNVLRIENAFVIVCWDCNTELQALHDLLKRNIEGALLSELCQSPKELTESEHALSSIKLVCYGDEPERIERALQAFAMKRQDTVGASWTEIIARLRGEAQHTGRQIDEEPSAVWSVDVQHSSDLATSKLTAELCHELKDTIWGEEPGRFFTQLAHQSRSSVPSLQSTNLEGVDAFEAAFVSKDATVIRWIPPILFQALCDQIAVVASQKFGAEIQWGQSETDEKGFTSPPLIRAKLDGTWVHIPLGLHLLQWCILPLQPGEEPATLSAWMRDQFGKGSPS